MTDSFRILVFGDVVGRPGRTALHEHLRGLRASFSANMVIANGENAAGGTGIDGKTAHEIFASGVDVITLGDHTWSRKEARGYIEKNTAVCIRPANYPEGAPGQGWTIWRSDSGLKIGVMNLLGRVFTTSILDCPFRKADEILNGPLKECKIIICDMHAEATSEKYAMGRHLDGRVSLVVGTHTHVQTADEQILPGGTAYITDLGMCGSPHGVIGMDGEVALERFKKGLPLSYKIAPGDGELRGVFCEINSSNGKPVRIVPVQKLE